MKALIAKRFKFHAAHQLVNHDGACSRMHGHSYMVEIGVHGTVNNRDGDPKEGMVLDFGELKKTFRELIEPKVDHQNLNETLPIPVTSAEYIAGWIFRVCKGEHPEVCLVRVWETDTSYAEVKNGDMLHT